MIRPWRPANKATGTSPLFRALIDVVPFMLLIRGILGSIYTGLATPTEAAAAGCISAS